MNTSSSLTVVTFATLAAGASATVIFTANSGPGTNTETAFVLADQVDPNLDNNSASAAETVNPKPESAEVSITGTATPTTVAVGDDLTYTLKITNNGPAAATNVIFSDTLPVGATFVSAIASQGGTSQALGIVTGNLGGLASGASATVTMIVIASAAGTLSDTATVRADQNDFNLSNNKVTITATSMQAAPTSVFGSLVDVSNGTYSVFVTWEYPSSFDGIASFNVYRSTTTGGEGAVPYARVSPGHFLVDTAVQLGKTYFYRVSAVVGGVESPRSGEMKIAVALGSILPAIKTSTRVPVVAAALVASGSATPSTPTGPRVAIQQLRAAPPCFPARMPSGKRRPRSRTIHQFGSPFSPT